MMTRLLLAAGLVAAAMLAPTSVATAQATAAPAKAAPATAAAPAADGPAVVLDAAAVWRIYHTFRPPVIQLPEGGTKPLLFNVKWLDWETLSPAADWTKPELNDRGWMHGPARRSAKTPYLAQLSLRGKFTVTDPAAAGELALALEYHGGVIAYLNGKELGRGNVSAAKGAGPAQAEAYPLAAFLDGQGELLKDMPKSPAAALRTRSLNLAIPKGRLVKGTNVLAIEVVRAPYPAILEEKHPGGVGGVSTDPGLIWNTCEIRAIKLTAASLDGLVTNASRPTGVQVWNADTLAGDVDADYGDRTEPLEAIAISSPRNGALYGKVMIGNDQPIRNLKVTAGDLKSEAGVIPAAQVSFLYGIPGGTEELSRSDSPSPYPDGVGFLHAVVPAPLSEFPLSKRIRAGGRFSGAVVPLWVRVKVPRDAQPGTYKGTVTITMADAAPVKVPVELKVLPWTMPDPQQFRTWVELVQSPDTLSVEYDAPLWSDKHFELIARSFKLVSNTGARSLYIPAIAHTNLGDAESMIRWIKKADGKYDWDFSVMDKYLDTAEKNLGTPKLVILQVWEVYMNTKDSTGRRFGEILAENQKTTGGAPLVTFVDAAGKTENGTIPKLNDPASKAIWQELLAKVRDRLKKRGLEKTLQLGMFTDSTPNKVDTQFFLDLAPDLPWVQQGHNAFSDLNGIAKVGYTATWWSQRFADDLVNRRSGAVGKATYKPHETVMTSLFGWNRPRQDAYYPRMTNEHFPISYWRMLCETAITGDFYCGIGRVGADYWQAVKGKSGKRAGWVNERFIEVSGYLHSLHSYVLEPQADGQVAMNRLLALEEGIQECEARIYIEDAMVNKALAKLDPELAKRCQATLDERLLYMWIGLNNMQCGGWGVTAWRFQAGVSGHAWLLNSGYHERTEKLYALAGEVEKKLGK